MTVIAQGVMRSRSVCCNAHDNPIDGNTAHCDSHHVRRWAQDLAGLQFLPPVDAADKWGAESTGEGPQGAKKMIQASAVLEKLCAGS